MSAKSPAHAGPCLRQQELIRDVQERLIRLAELSREASAALDARDDKLLQEIDIAIELELGAKERGMGKLQLHREEHGC